MKIYRIRRTRDGKFYRGRSKFTSHGTYFRMDQIVQNIGWVLAMCPQIGTDKIEIISYDVVEEDTIEVGKSEKEFFEILERNEKINDILDGDT